MTTKTKTTKTRKTSGRKARKDAYEVITSRIIEALDAGTIPWRQTWKGGLAGVATNLKTGKAYNGINSFALAIFGMDYSSNLWATYKQAQDLGGHVRKGEKGYPVLFWSIYEKENEETGKIEKRFFARYSTVFNLDQLEDVRVPKGRIVELPEPTEADDEEAFDRAVAIFNAYTERESIGVRHGGGRAFYRPADDSITLPTVESFPIPEDYVATAMHEAGHSTGAEKRLGRKGIEDFDFFGSHQYADEELVAEFTATYVCAVAGIERDAQIENAAAYIASWKKKLEDDPKIIVHAASRAQKAADLILDTAAAKADPEVEEA